MVCRRVRRGACAKSTCTRRLRSRCACRKRRNLGGSMSGLHVLTGSRCPRAPDGSASAVH